MLLISSVISKKLLAIWSVFFKFIFCPVKNKFMMICCYGIKIHNVGDACYLSLYILLPCFDDLEGFLSYNKPLKQFQMMWQFGYFLLIYEKKLNSIHEFFVTGYLCWFLAFLIKFFVVFSIVFKAVYLQLAVIGLYNGFCGHFQPSFNSIRHRFSEVSRKYLNGELCNNNEQLKAVNYCCKALHLRCLQVTSLRLWHICLFFYITLVFLGIWIMENSAS